MIGHDIYDCFTMEHFLLYQSMILTTSFFCSRQYIYKVYHSKSKIKCKKSEEYSIKKKRWPKFLLPMNVIFS
jgi:hypothetical protein